MPDKTAVYNLELNLDFSSFTTYILKQRGHRLWNVYAEL